MLFNFGVELKPRLSHGCFSDQNGETYGDGTDFAAQTVAFLLEKQYMVIFEKIEKGSVTISVGICLSIFLGLATITQSFQWLYRAIISRGQI